MHGYRADTAFDGERAVPGGALVLVEDGSIVAVEPGSAPAPDGCEVRYHPGTTLLPGLIDTHTHLCTDASSSAFERLPDLTTEQLDADVRLAMQAQLAAGITTVRDLGDHHWAVLERHREHSDAPRVLAAGPPITSVGGHCWALGGEAAGVDQLRAAVGERAERGADVVKIMSSGGVMTSGTDVMQTQFSLPELQAVVDEAHARGLAVTAHAHGLPAVQQCLAAGMDGIEHCSCLVPEGLGATPELREALAVSGIYVCPTLGIPTDMPAPPKVQALLDRLGMTRDGPLAHVAELYRAGVTLVSGSDAGISPPKQHGVLLLALEELAACGVPNDVVLATATSVAARACGLPDQTGRLRAGLDADLLVVDGDPTQELSMLAEPDTGIRALMKGGRWVRNALAT